jgi:hypothetical protein
MNPKRLILSCLLTIAALIILVTKQQQDNKNLSKKESGHLRRQATTSNNHGARPIMHTFFEPDQAGEDDLLQVWAEEWQRAGFDTRVLSLKDAEKHPYFPTMKKAKSYIW